MNLLERNIQFSTRGFNINALNTFNERLIKLGLGFHIW